MNTFDLTQPMKSQRLPYYLQSSKGDPVNVPMTRKGDKGETINYSVKIPGAATIDIVADPKTPVCVGDTVFNPGFGLAGSSYEVTGATEGRPARGDFSFYGFTPIWQQITVVYKPTA